MIRVSSAVCLLLTLCSISAFARMPNERMQDSRSKQSNSWLSLFDEQKQQWIKSSGLLQFTEDISTLYDMWSGNSNESKNRRTHSESGALRSGEGSPDQIAMRARMFEERQKLDDLEASGEYTTDLRTSKRQFEYWKEKMQNKRTSKQDDRFDLIEEDSVPILEDIAMMNLAEGENKGGRQLSSINDQGELIIHRLDEPYPTECYNHG